MGLVMPKFGFLTFVSSIVLKEIFLIDIAITTVISDASVLDICL